MDWVERCDVIIAEGVKKMKRISSALEYCISMSLSAKNSL